jgi:hypothetical protein
MPPLPPLSIPSWWSEVPPNTIAASSRPGQNTDISTTIPNLLNPTVSLELPHPNELFRPGCSWQNAVEPKYKLFDDDGQETGYLNEAGWKELKASQVTQWVSLSKTVSLETCIHILMSRPTITGKTYENVHEKLAQCLESVALLSYATGDTIFDASAVEQRVWLQLHLQAETSYHFYREGFGGENDEINKTNLVDNLENLKYAHRNSTTVTQLFPELASRTELPDGTPLPLAVNELLSPSSPSHDGASDSGSLVHTPVGYEGSEDWMLSKKDRSDHVQAGVTGGLTSGHLLGPSLLPGVPTRRRVGGRRPRHIPSSMWKRESGLSL